MIIAVFSDIHGNYQALKAILNDIRKNNIKSIVCLGDIIGLGPSSRDCLKLLERYNIKHAIGNHELYYINGTNKYGIAGEEAFHHEWIKKSIGEEYIDKLNDFPLQVKLKVGSKKFLFEHFFVNDEEYPFYPLNILNGGYKDVINNTDADYIFIGHEHSEKYYEVNDKKCYCVGSSGCVKNGKTFYHIITIDKSENVNYYKKVINYDRDSFINVMNHIDYPEKDKLSKIFFGI